MDEVTELLRAARVIAVVGLSDDPERSSYGVADYLRRAGYRVLPVNPNIAAWNGEPAAARLGDLREPVDVVCLFRRPEFVPAHVEEAIAIGARAVWMQQGIRHEEAARAAEAAGLMVVQNRCIALEHSKHKSDLQALND